MYTLYKYIYIYTPPLRGGGGVKTEIFQKGVGPPPTPRNISAKKMVSPYIYIYFIIYSYL